MTQQLVDERIAYAFEHPEEFDWTLPDEYETAVFDALETGEGFVRGSRVNLVVTALRQAEPIRITMCGDGWKATRPL